jgi:drug/metabolite transporter (DMT)-like permease
MQHPVFSRRNVVFALATFCCLLWGSAYPAIKNGYAAFSIAASDIPAKMVFAGWRFLGAGLILLVLARLTGRAIWQLSRKNWGELALLGFTQTAVQYVFFYVGLAYTTGVKGSIMNGTAVFFGVLLGHFLYKNDRLNPAKIAGCLIGFAGVVVVNFTHDLLNFDFTLLGEGFVVIAALILSIGMVYGKKISQHMDSTVMTAWQLTLGGAILLAAGYPLGGHLGAITVTGSLLLLYLCLLSSAAFALWSLLLKYNRVGMISVFNFLVPIFGAALSALFLGETIMEWKNVVALVLVCSGIWLVAFERKR